MAALQNDVKAFIVQALACFDTPSQVVEAVQKEYGVQALQSAYRDDTGEGDLADALQGYNASASFAQEVKTRASQNAAMVQRQTELTAEVGEVSGSVSELESVVVTDREATSQAIQQVRAEIGETSAAVQVVSQAQADTDGKFSTMYSVKMQVNADGQLVAAGFGLGIEQDEEGVLQSQFLVSADRFSIVSTLAGGQAFTPFTVDNGQVFMRSTFIQDGSIPSLRRCWLEPPAHLMDAV